LAQQYGSKYHLCGTFVMITLSAVVNISVLLSGYLSLSRELGAAVVMAPAESFSFDSLFPPTTNTSNSSHTINHQDSGFGACLLIMDDNHRLPEWIAYHYHVLPLQYLVVAVDPHSETSPSPILKSWRQRHADLQIVEWNATDIYEGKMEEYKKVASMKKSLDQYLQMQNMFLRNCLRHMKEMNRTWVAVLDSDEFLHFNGKPGQVAQPDRVPKDSFYRLVVPGISYPSIHTKASIWNFLKYLDQYPQPRIPEQHALWQFYPKERGNRTTVYVPPCITIPRLLFGAVESTEAERYKGVVGGETAGYFNPNHLSTLRHRKHIQRKKPSASNGWAKVIVDVSRVTWEDFPSLHEAWNGNGFPMNVHKPIGKHCAQPFFTDDGAASLFRINHYVGSYEAFSYRMDARSGRDASKWQKKASISDETYDNIRPWLSGLVEYEGLEQAEEMLFMAGHFTPKPPKKENI
jgi:hypothetical protein